MVIMGRPGGNDVYMTQDKLAREMSLCHSSLDQLHIAVWLLLDSCQLYPLLYVQQKEKVRQ